MSRQFRIFLVFATGIMVFFACYVLVICLQSYETVATKQEVQFEEAWHARMGTDQKKELSKCLQNTRRIYSRTWNRHCKRLGKNPDCPLPSYIANSLDRLYQDDRKDCFRSVMEKRSNL